MRRTAHEESLRGKEGKEQLKMPIMKEEGEDENYRTPPIKPA